jgi:UDP-N-acetylglucosamine 2-epimerase (non-hydrolysing)
MPILFIIGTRPEAIKLLPLFSLFKERSLPAFLCLSMQHEALVIDLLELFGCTADYILSFDVRPHTLNTLSSAIIAQFDTILSQKPFSWVFIQGDTATVFCGALAAFNKEIRIAHVEAGLRTHNLAAPFPEEGYRQMVSRITSLHYAPTKQAVANLQAEGINPETVVMTGNTVVDSLHQTLKKIIQKTIPIDPELAFFCHEAHVLSKKLFVLTAHRREAHGKPLEDIFRTVIGFLQANPNVWCVYATHPNPGVRRALVASGFIDADGTLNKKLQEQVFFTQPLPYPELIFALHAATCTATDSGGIQEEAIALGKPVICLRETTERTEGIALGLTTLVGSDTKKITAALTQALFEPHAPTQGHAEIYGDGTACEKIFLHFISIYHKTAIPFTPRASTCKTEELRT